MVKVKENIEILKKAQELDREIYAAQVMCEEIPELRAQIKSELEQEKARLKELEVEHKKLQLKQKEKEGELQQKEGNVKKFEGQLGSVKTNKEYSALQQEIASLKADSSLLEEEIIRAMDQAEAADEEVKKERERLKLVEKELQEKETQINQKEKQLLGNADGLKKRREEIILLVEPEVKNLYDLIVQKKKGLALVKVNGEICGACQLQLRPQVLNEIRLGESLIICENCSRILYIEE